jgi:hypothetical protein
LITRSPDGSRTLALAIAGVLCTAGVAHADDFESLESDAPKSSREPLALQIADTVTDLGHEIDAHLGLLSAGTLSLRVDGRSREVHVSFHVEGDDSALRIRSDVRVRGGSAKVYAQIDLQLIGRHLHLDVPEIDLVPRSLDGERYVEVRLPIWTQSF